MVDTAMSQMITIPPAIFRDEALTVGPLRLYAVLEANPTISLGQAARTLGHSRKTISTWIKILTDKQYVVIERRATCASDEALFRFPLRGAQA